jgi:hypothetical protein
LPVEIVQQGNWEKQQHAEPRSGMWFISSGHGLRVSWRIFGVRTPGRISPLIKR